MGCIKAWRTCECSHRMFSSVLIHRKFHSLFGLGAGAGGPLGGWLNDAFGWYDSGRSIGSDLSYSRCLAQALCVSLSNTSSRLFRRTCDVESAHPALSRATGSEYAGEAEADGLFWLIHSRGNGRCPAPRRITQRERRPSLGLANSLGSSHREWSVDDRVCDG